MKHRRYILVINPGSTSTKIAIFEGEKCLIYESLFHSIEEVNQYIKIYDQKDMRINVILNWLKEKEIKLEELLAVVGRGGLLRPIPGGTYKVTELMLEDLKTGYQGEHASNLGGIIAKEISKKAGVEAFIVDPVSVDEFQNIARVTGIPEIQRRSLVHALNIKAVIRRVCHKLDISFDKSNFIVAHLGGGISVAPVEKGKIIDCNNANEEGPFSPERSAGLPAHDVIELAYGGQYEIETLKKKLIGQGGLVGYLGINDARKIDQMIEAGDKKAELVFRAMAYQIGKEIGSMATVLKGKVDVIILTGGLAYNRRITNWIKQMVEFIAPIEIVPGEYEMLALAKGALRVINKQEKVKIYEKEVHKND